jgi:hypothetical protein
MNLGSQDVLTSISAAGTTQATATELIAGISYVSTVAFGAGVALSPNATPGTCQIVYNAGANALKVYPISGAQINQITADSPHVLATNTACTYWFVTSTKIVGLLSA